MTKSKSTKIESASDPGRRYKLGVALSGGGARGLAHIGALLAIEDAGLKPDVIAGVSAGSVAAVLYAGGVRPLRIAQIFAGTTFRDFAELSFGHGGLMKIDKFRDIILRELGDKRCLEDLDIPTFIGATDLDNARPHIFTTGEIGPRMIASCSIPIVFTPVLIDGIHYVDGGVLRNHPAWMLREQCETLIGINVSPLKQRTRYNSIIEVALRTYNLMAKANQSVDMALCDVSVETPQIADVAPFNLKNIKDIVLTGYRNTRRALIDAGLWQTQEKDNK